VKSLEDHNVEEVLQDAQGFHTDADEADLDQPAESEEEPSDSSSSTSNHFKLIRQKKGEGQTTEQCKEEQQRQQVFEEGCRYEED
jgi:hypothetical protein